MYFPTQNVLQSGALRMKRETAYQSIYSCNCDKHELNTDKVILNCWEVQKCAGLQPLSIGMVSMLCSV